MKNIAKTACVAALLTALAITAGAWVKSQDKNKTALPKAAASRVVDSGSFGIFMEGKRVGTETFHIEEGPGVSVATSDVKIDDGANKLEQHAEMRVASNGALRFYRWWSTLPSREEVIVEAKDDFLLEHITSADQKKMDISHILPTSTSILDDYVFSHREILAWRYLATSCVIKDGNRACSRGIFGVLVPRQHTAVNASVELVERNVTKIKGVDQELNQMKVDTGGELWLIWMDDQFKVQKMAIPTQKVEVERD
jgi:hypothetical protein